MKRFLISVGFAIIFAMLPFASLRATPPDNNIGNEYYDAIVLLIDHEKGMLAVSIPDETTGKEKKFSFVVDRAELYVSSPSGQEIEFSQIQTGDRVDLSTHVENGIEKVVDIMDFDRFPME